jgi:hypothetical protein
LILLANSEGCFFGENIGPAKAGGIGLFQPKLNLIPMKRPSGTTPTLENIGSSEFANSIRFGANGWKHKLSGSITIDSKDD